jgi:glycosyltransferase involved in cell wall biosynthesis
MSYRKRLLVLTSSYPSNATDGRAAAGFFVRDFINTLSESSEVTVLTQQTDNGSTEIEMDNYSIVRFPWPGKDRPLSTLRFPGDLIPIICIMVSGFIASIRQIRKKKITHVVALWAIPSGIWALAAKGLLGVPYSIWCLGSDIWSYQNSPAMRLVLKIVLRNADKVYADGFQLSDAVEEISKVNCQYLPSSRNFTVPDSKRKLAPENVRHYLFVGRYHHNKGPDILVEAINLIAEEIRCRVHFHFFGGGDLEQEMRDAIEKNDLANTITLGGFIGESMLTEMLFATDVIVIPSRIDTISLMVSAALQMEKVIIATDVGDMGHVLEKYNAGYVVPSESAKALAMAIQKDISTPYVFSPERSSLKELLNISNSAATMLNDINLSKNN